MRAFFALVAAVLLFVLTGWVLMNYVFITDEQRIERLIEKGRAAVENGSILTLTGLLDSQYTHESRLDRATVLRALQNMFQNSEERRVHFLNRDIAVEGQTATAQIRFVFDAEAQPNQFSAPGAMQALGSAQEMTLRLSKEDGGWAITHSALQ